MLNVFTATRDIQTFATTVSTAICLQYHCITTTHVWSLHNSQHATATTAANKASVLILLARRCIQRSALVTEHSSRHFRLSVHRCDYCGHIRGWIAMPFGMVSRVGFGSGVLDFGGDRRRGRGSLGVNLRRSRADHGNDQRSTRV